MPKQRTIPCICRRCSATFLVCPSDVRRGRGGYCSRECYQRSRMERARPIADRLWENIDRSGGPDTCWPWMGATNKAGYGVLRVGSKRDGSAHNELAHRLAWELVNGPIPDETPFVLHHCDNPPCCNVERCHFLGTHITNAADMMSKGRNGFRRRYGEQNHATTIPAGDVALMRERYAAGERITTLSAARGVAYQTVWRIVTGRSRISG